MSTLAVTLAGETLLLHPQRALLWPRLATLLVADVHLGKGDILRRHGIPLPSGDSDPDLERLAAMVAAHGIERLVVLGDLVHGRVPDAAPWLDRLAAFRAGHRQLALQLVGGNHDRWLRPAELGFEDLGERWLQAPFVGVHEVGPEPDPAGFQLGGHVHPVVHLGTRHRRVRVPVFWQRSHGLTLPSFGALTGGFAISPGRGERLYACADAVHPLQPG